MNLSRRRFLRATALLGAGSITACQSLTVKPHAKASVVVVGGGFAGATLAKIVHLLDTDIHVTLIEAKSRYTTCPGSNWLFAGLTDLEHLTLDYAIPSQRYGIDIMTDRVSHIDSSKRLVHLASGQIIAYDRLVLAPGIDFRWNAIEGYDATTAEQFPHAWQAGAQTLSLARRLQALPQGGVIVMSVPADPYRCPPGPYERASMMAWWLKHHNPRAKLIILDHKRHFAKQALFETLWKRHYAYGTEHSLIEWHSLADNPLLRFDARSKTLFSEFGDHFTGDVINLIPPQQAGKLAIDTGLGDITGWCPVQASSSQSLFDPFVHVIGDAAHVPPLPKSAFAANSQAKACALAIVASLNDNELPPPTWLNTCYSLVTPEQGISIAGVYRLNTDGHIEAVPGSGGVSTQMTEAALQREARYAKAAYHNLVANSFT